MLFFNIPWAWVATVLIVVSIWLPVGTWMYVRTLPGSLPPNEAAIEFVLSMPIRPVIFGPNHAIEHPLHDTARGALDRIRAHGAKPVRTGLNEVCTDDLQRCYVVTDLPPMAALSDRVSLK
jgi:hypothetical protein